ncbi:persephin [Elephas maximus indicus]|uniref:persephin n=1 Tax=Elephas maximus indicus TaxID=99487 RepID=UPI0021164736|nr:persephin [Elephas maximus indicus]
MAPGGGLFHCLLLLWLLLGLSWGAAALGSPVAESAAACPGPACCQLPYLPPGTGHPLSRLRRATASPCRLWSLTLPVAELGLGYASEERVVFRYCAGSCPHGARTQHGLTLAWLRGQGRAHSGPCCRPTRYADVDFLDDSHRWQRLVQLSAAACGCE